MAEKIEASKEKLAAAGFAELEKRGFRVGASDLGIDDLVAVLGAMQAVQAKEEPVAYRVIFNDGERSRWEDGTPQAQDLYDVRDGVISGVECAYAHHVAPIALPEPEQLFEAIAGALGEAMDCTRVWAAWGAGTMSEDDFSLVADDQDRLHEIATACLDKIKESSANADPSVPKCDGNHGGGQCPDPECWNGGEPSASKCCTPSDEEKALLANGDYTPEELWGGSRPTCPKCITCNDNGAVGNILNSEPCPDCAQVECPNIEAAAQKLAACMDYPWEFMPEQGRASMREHAKAIIEAAKPGASQ